MPPDIAPGQGVRDEEDTRELAVRGYEGIRQPDEIAEVASDDDPSGGNGVFEDARIRREIMAIPPERADVLNVNASSDQLFECAVADTFVEEKRQMGQASACFRYWPYRSFSAICASTLDGDSL